jgi:hypothetical protein
METSKQPQCKELILEKHVDFIAGYGKKHDVYVKKQNSKKLN